MRARGQHPLLGTNIGLEALIVAAIAVGLSACEGAPAREKRWRHESHSKSLTTAADPGAGVGRARPQGTIRIHMGTRPGHLHPMVSPTEWGTRITAGSVFETLATYREDGDRRVLAPALAESWIVGGSARTIRFELRKDVKFHDGRPLTSVDVQFSIDGARSPRRAAPHLRHGLADITSVELAGPRAVRVRLARPNANVMRALALVPILPAHIYRAHMKPTRGPVVGTGPFKLASWDDSGVVLKQHLEYWGTPPGVRRIEFVHVPDYAEALTKAKEGFIDIVPELIPEHVPEQIEAATDRSDFTVLRLRPPALRYLVMNCWREPFSDRRAREALSLAIDVNTLAQEGHGGLAWAPGGLSWPGGPGDADVNMTHRFDLDKSSRLLDAAGYTRTGKGVRHRGRDSLRVDVLVTGEDSPDRRAVLSALDGIGIGKVLRKGPSAVLKGRMRAADFDLAFVDFRGPVATDLESIVGDRRTNYGKCTSLRSNELFKSIRASFDFGVRHGLAGELAAVLEREVLIVPLSAPDPQGLVHERVRGVKVWSGWIDLAALTVQDR